MAEPFSLFGPLDRRPLRESERALIERAVTTAWDDAVRLSLARACVDRGLLIGAYDTVDVLVHALESVAASGEERER